MPPLPVLQAIPDSGSSNTTDIFQAAPGYTRFQPYPSFFHCTCGSLPPDFSGHSHFEFPGSAKKALRTRSFLPSPPASDDPPPPCVPTAFCDNTDNGMGDHCTGRKYSGNCSTLTTPFCTMCILTGTLYRPLWHRIYPLPQSSSSLLHAAQLPAFWVSA